MSKTSGRSDRKTAGVVAGAMVLALAFSSCSNADGGGEYSLSDLSGFSPDEGTFTWSDAWTQQAGDAWQTNWPDSAEMLFDPPECLDYTAAVEIMLASDESATAGDGLAFFQGVTSDPDTSEDGFVGVLGKMRVFSSESAADDFVQGLRSMAMSCSGGYSLTFTEDGMTASVDSVAVSTAGLDGVGEVLVIDERSWTLEADVVVIDYYPHYTHYVYSQGNAVIVASYFVAGGTASNDDAADLIGQFIDHLG